MKIAYCIESLYNSRGTERVLTVCANMLCHDYDITIITAFNHDKSDYYKLDKKIRRVDLGVETVNVRRWSSLVYNPTKERYKKQLSEYLFANKQDIVVSLGGLEMYFLPSIKDGSKKVLWFHFSFNISRLFVAESYLRLIRPFAYSLQTIRRVVYARRFNQIVVLSKSDLKSWSKYCRHCTYIYNPLTIKVSQTSTCKNFQAIAVGVLGIQKGFDYLVDAWEIISRKHPNWCLNIFGDGPDREKLQNQIRRNKLESVVKLKGITNNIAKEYSNHSLFVLSSRAEGFGLVLVEASAFGLPLVSFNCPQGPSEIIENGVNGFLVEQIGDVKSLADAIDVLISNEQLRLKMGKNALVSSKRYSEDVIIKEWHKLFCQLIDL